MPTEVAPRRSRRRRVLAMSLWAVAFAVYTVVGGLPLTDPIGAFAWFWAAVIAWNSDRPWREHLRFARDWLPIVVLLVGYNVSRSFADNGATPHAIEMVHADRAMFGGLTGGVVPTVWLQQHLYHPRHVRWYDVLVSWVYFSHFIASLSVAVVLWVRSRARWAAYMRRYIFLSVAGLVTYFAYPAAPPWWAAQHGLIEPVSRISTRGWELIGLHGAGNLLNKAQLGSNPVAAMPSLHTAFALFVVVFFFGTVAKRWWPVLLLYPLAMTFTLVYSGEHYMIDVLVGWVYVGLTFAAVGLAERWWSARRRSRERERADEESESSVAASA